MVTRLVLPVLSGRCEVQKRMKVREAGINRQVKGHTSERPSHPALLLEAAHATARSLQHQDGLSLSQPIEAEVNKTVVIVLMPDGIGVAMGFLEVSQLHQDGLSPNEILYVGVPPCRIGSHSALQKENENSI
jgi:hypothetical protein